MSEVLSGDATTTGVPFADVLVEFGEAMLGEDTARRTSAREALYNSLGPGALVDAAATVASFNAVVKVADATGIPLEDFKADATVDLRAELGLEKFNHIAS